MTKTVYAIGDVHGHLDKLEDAIFQIDKDGGADAKVVFLGDLVDRGPDSQGVVEFVLFRLEQGRNWRVLTGNHDRMFRLFLEPVPRADHCLRSDLTWLHPRLGGAETLASYGVNVADLSSVDEIHAAARATVPQTHLKFLSELPYHHLDGDVLFVHAGVRPDVPLTAQTDDDLCWIRDPFLSYRKPHPWLVVHGHTPEEHPTHHGNRVCLDTGAGYGHKLSVGVFEDGDVFSLTSKGRDRLHVN